MFKPLKSTTLLIAGLIFTSWSSFSFAQYNNSVQREWLALPVGIQTCMFGQLKGNGTSITEAIQNGVAPRDVRMVVYMDACRVEKKIIAKKPLSKKKIVTDEVLLSPEIPSKKENSANDRQPAQVGRNRDLLKQLDGLE